MPATTVMNIGSATPATAGKLTHYSIEVLFEESIAEAKSKCGNPKAALRVYLEAKTETGEWEKVYTGLSKSYTHMDLQSSKAYWYRLRIDSSVVKSEWSVPVTFKTLPSPYTGDDLHHAIKRSNLHKVETILNSGDVQADVQDARDLSALVIAGLEDSSETMIKIMDLLIENGADINRKDANGKTPLIHAAGRGKLEFAKYLCEKGAETPTLDKAGMAAIHYATDGGFVKIVEWMLDNSELYGFDIEQEETSTSMTPLNRCANMTPDSKAYEMAASLQLRGADMTKRSKNNYNPLQNAIIRRKPQLVKFFLDRGADIYEKNEEGKTPYDIAKSVGNVQILRAFEDRVSLLSMLPKSKKKQEAEQQDQSLRAS